MFFQLHCAAVASHSSDLSLNAGCPSLRPLPFLPYTEKAALPTRPASALLSISRDSGGGEGMASSTTHTDGHRILGKLFSLLGTIQSRIKDTFVS
jgi:hypothetical protein